MRKVNRGQRAKPKTIPAPVGGLNGRDGLAAMPETDAYLMQNLFPGTATVDIRGGSAPHVTGIPGPVESLETYAGGASPKLLAFAAGSAYDVSISGAVGAALASSFLSNQVVSSMFSNAGSQFLIGVTGADLPFSYEGTTLSDLTMTGVTQPEKLSHVNAFKGRLYFAYDTELAFYYLPVGAIQGALAKFDLSQVALLGGYLVAMASFSQDSGKGKSDYAVFITSEGEYIVYEGYDPSSAATWELVSRYYSAPPIGRKCAFNYNSDLVIITLEGAIPFSEIRKEGGAGAEDAITSKLGKFLADKNSYAATHGWQATAYPRGGMLILNVPQSHSVAGEYNQFVMNTKTNAWTEFTDWNGISWNVFNNRLYFGTYDGKVYLADEGALDDGMSIHFDCKQAYNYFDDGFGSGWANKHFHFAKLLVASDGEPPLSAQFNVDYVENQPDYVNSPPEDGLGEWDTATWDASSWAVDSTTRVFLAALGKYGTAGSLWLRGSMQGTSFKWYATQYVYEKVRGLF